jgi:pimeloyl-ACP methyl ester carboxylesterase
MKRNLIILHGALGAALQFRSLAKLLQDDFEVHSIDFRGHGLNDSESDFRIAHFAEDVEKYMKNNEISRPPVFGYSMGGYVALYLESTNPSYFEGIFTLGTKFDWNAESSEKEAGYLDPEVIREKLPSYASFLEDLHGPNWAKNVLKTREMMLHMGNFPDLDPKKLGDVEARCLLSVGALDKMVTKDETERAARLIKRGSFRIWDAMPHPFEKADVSFLSQKIKEFFLK